MIKSMGKKSKMITCLICIVVIAVALIYSNICIFGSYVITDSIIVQETRIDDYSIRLKGTTASSATGFSGHKLIYNDKILYVKLKYSLVSQFNPSGDFLIEEGGYYEGVKKVYLQGPQENDLKLIWSK